MDVIPGIEKRVESTEEFGHFCWKKDYARNEEKGGLNYLNNELMDK